MRSTKIIFTQKSVYYQLVRFEIIVFEQLENLIDEIMGKSDFLHLSAPTASLTVNFKLKGLTAANKSKTELFNHKTGALFKCLPHRHDYST